MIVLVAVGDRVRPGRYGLRARFRRAADFHGPGGWLAVAEESLGRGPIRVTLRGGLPARLLSVTVERSAVRLDEAVLRFDEDAVYRSTLDAVGWDAKRLRENAWVLEKTLLRLAHPKSLAFLIDRRREEALRAGFERTYAERMRGGWEKIRTGRTGEGTARIRGSGFGLTPSGDDFLTGLLATLRLREALGDPAAGERRAEIRAALDPPGETLSEAYLALAGEGAFPERLKNLAEALLSGGSEETAMRSEELIDSGATSGADTATGVFLGLRLGFERVGREDGEA
ncbi:MAG: DUF2877 domain-containing protein [Candidatus Eisenbacteria bacterium]|nr:DUF2877 domain-containing protein [Candidatus Eisenbacteria bacterium]